jgi:hypothetical protein
MGMVVLLLVFRLDVTVQVLILMNGVGRTRGFLSRGGRLERDFKPRRARGHSLRWQRGD